MSEPVQTRKRSRGEAKRTFILGAAREIFEQDGLEGASLRAIAARAGYTPAALYFHFPSKEAIYAELLRSTLVALRSFVQEELRRHRAADVRLRAAAMAFFGYYASNPSDLDLGFYLFRGGMKPAGLDRETDRELNAALEAALRPIAAAAVEMGASPRFADLLMADVFAHSTGLLLLFHTGRIRMFNASAEMLMADFVESKLLAIKEGAET